MDSDNPMGTRAHAAYDAMGNKLDEKSHEMKKEEHKEQSGITGMVSGIKNVFGAAYEKVTETVYGTKSEVNPDNTRTEATYDTMDDKWYEKSHEMKKEEHKEPSRLSGVVEGIKNTFGAASEKVSETIYGTKYEANKDIAQNPDNDLSTRAKATKDAVEDKMSEKTHEMKKEEYQEPSRLTGVVEGIKNTFGAASEKVSETVYGTKYEVNKDMALNPDNDLSTRAKATKDAVEDKISEKTHEMNKDQQSERAGLTSETP